MTKCLPWSSKASVSGVNSCCSPCPEEPSYVSSSSACKSTGESGENSEARSTRCFAARLVSMPVIATPAALLGKLNTECDPKVAAALPVVRPLQGDYRWAFSRGYSVDVRAGKKVTSISTQLLIMTPAIYNAVQSNPFCHHRVTSLSKAYVTHAVPALRGIKIVADTVVVKVIDKPNLAAFLKQIDQGWDGDGGGKQDQAVEMGSVYTDVGCTARQDGQSCVRFHFALSVNKLAKSSLELPARQLLLPAVCQYYWNNTDTDSIDRHRFHGELEIGCCTELQPLTFFL